MDSEGRLRALQARMRACGMAAAVLFQSRDVFYYTGTGQPCNLAVPQQGPATLFARRALDFVRQETSLGDVRAGGSFAEVADWLRALGLDGGPLGIEEDVLPARMVRGLRAALPAAEWRDISPLILAQRAIKDAAEVAAVRRAAQLFAAVHAVVLARLRPGISEAALSACILEELTRRGGIEPPRLRRFDAVLPPAGLVVAGPNLARVSGYAMTVTGVGVEASMPWGPSLRPIEAGELVVVDVATASGGYHADVARTYVAGRATPRQRDLFGAVKAILDSTLQAVRPGLPASALFAHAQAAAAEGNVGAFFMGYGAQQGQYIGHGLGLELDEPPNLVAGSTQPLEVGMTFAVEPKLIHPSFGAVDVEETVVVTDRGCERLSVVENELFEVL